MDNDTETGSKTTLTVIVLAVHKYLAAHKMTADKVLKDFSAASISKINILTNIFFMRKNVQLLAIN